MDDVLTLAQWLSPAYPVGAFAYAHGLEQAVADGFVSDAATLEAWLRDVLEHGGGWSDAVLLAAAWRGDAQAYEVARAFASGEGRLIETLEQGTAFARVTGAVWGTDDAQLPMPVALGQAAAARAIPLDLTLAMYLQSMLTNLVSAAQRLAPVGQTEAQGIVRRLTSVARDVAERAEDSTLEDLSSVAWLSDIAAMRHEMKSVKVFRT
ncbi:Urease accessory protein UreF [Rhodobacteraceae bacterium THAF1]|uniref:urease accessory protein UreF n=1 Tax=Palleronia sp. THAF1 TaxID=2587842 RepID=UPI000F3EC598|nr:urease accessory UreF family protein [Palleronia sp. THAF1]QFU08046.1 Urease accessory protein UreF [Palleronia sp. THAF1]VDC27900.1 Urease accessory protein UreF [Rhodobacteraceae bacterium THAF1]